jgi:secreted trypsin-like serine protease
MEKFTSFVAVAVFCALAVLPAAESRPSSSSSPAAARSSVDVPPTVPRIIGGTDASDGEFPYMLELEYYGSLGWLHQCGAVLLDARHAISGAKCVASSNVINLRLWAGMLIRANYTVTNSQQISLSSVAVHPLYNEYNSGLPYDISVLTFSWDADLTRYNVEVATLPPDDSLNFVGSTCTIIGWGRFSDEQSMSFTLLKADQVVISNADCTAAMTGVSNSQISDVHICVESIPAGNGGICSGDAGSPVICEASYGGGATASYVVGLSSWTVMQNYMCNVYYPGVATRVGHVLDWIYENTAL